MENNQSSNGKIEMKNNYSIDRNNYMFKNKKEYTELNKCKMILKIYIHYLNIVHGLELKLQFKKYLFKSGKIMSSFYFIIALFSLQSFFLRQNLEFKKRNFIS